MLPEGFDADFSRQQQEAILAHELAHLASKDPSWHSAALVLCSPLWWHPLVWWSRRRLRAASEAAADEASLLVPDGPRVLAESLVWFGRRLVRPRPLAGVSIEGRGFRSGLGRRVERLLSLPCRSWRAEPRRHDLHRLMLPIVFALTAIFGTAWAPSQVPFTGGETTMSVFKTSWRCSLAATALWALAGSSPGQAMAGDQPAQTPATKAAPAPANPDALKKRLMEMKKGVERRNGHVEVLLLSAEIDARVKHLRAAAENLKAAGYQKEAEGFMKVAHSLLNQGALVDLKVGELTSPPPGFVYVTLPLSMVLNVLEGPKAVPGSSWSPAAVAEDPAAVPRFGGVTYSTAVAQGGRPPAVMGETSSPEQAQADLISHATMPPGFMSETLSHSDLDQLRGEVKQLREEMREIRAHYQDQGRRGAEGYSGEQKAKEFQKAREEAMKAMQALEEENTR